MKRHIYKGSYTIEAAIYIPFIMFLMLHTLEIAIDNWQLSRDREIREEVQSLNVVREFYFYQILEEVEKELENAKE